MNPIRKVLVVQPYGIGDLLFITPVLRALKVLPGIECVDLLLGSRTDVIVKNNPHVDEIMIVNKDTFHDQSRFKTFKDVLSLGLKLRKKKYDLLLDFSLRSEYAFFSQFLLGISRRAGFAYKRRAMFHNIRYPLSEGYTGKHVADLCADLAEKAGVPVRSRWLEFYDDPKMAESACKIFNESNQEKSLENFIVLSPGGGESWGKDAHFKRWPLASFAALVTKLHSELEFDGVVLVGSPAEREMAENLQAKLTLPVLNLVGKLSLGETAWVLGQGLFFLGNDGGLLHLARAMNRAVIGVYGPVDDEVYGPYPHGEDSAVVFHQDLDCRPCYFKFRYKSDCEHRDCLQQLDASEALKQIKQQGFWDYFKKKKASA